MKSTAAQTRITEVRHNEQKWTKPLMDAGWTVLPSVLLDRQQALGLDATDINILAHLATYWWYRDNPPHPAKGRVAAALNIDPSTVRRRIARMESENLIRRQARFDAVSGRQETNVYRFDGLIEKLTPFAHEAIEAKKRRLNENAARRTRKKPPR